MATVVIMPKQGLMMEEGTITSWLKKEGETVSAGEPLFEMETDKLTITMDAEDSGTLLKIIHPEGDVVPITQPIAVLGQPGEDISALVGGGAAPAAAPAEAAPAPAAEAPAVPAVERAPGQRVFSSPRARLRAEENGVDIAAVPGSGPDGLVIERDVNAFAANRPAVTPLAANLARAQGVDLSGVTGTGPNGKITAADLPGAAPATPEAPAAEAPAAVQQTAQQTRGTRTEKMSGMRKAISRNMLASKAANAQTNHRITVDMTAAIALRRQFKDLGIKISYNDIIVRACARTLMDMPIVNASVDGNNILYHDYVNVGTAVSVPGGLIVPVIRDANLKDLRTICLELADLTDRAKAGKLGSDDLGNASITITNLGMFGITYFTPIINAPEGAILGVGCIVEKMLVKDGGFYPGSILNLSLTHDHRVINGAPAARFLQEVVTGLQNFQWL